MPCAMVFRSARMAWWKRPCSKGRSSQCIKLAGQSARLHRASGARHDIHLPQHSTLPSCSRESRRTSANCATRASMPQNTCALHFGHRHDKCWYRERTGRWEQQRRLGKAVELMLMQVAPFNKSFLVAPPGAGCRPAAVPAAHARWRPAPRGSRAAAPAAQARVWGFPS